MKEDYHQQDQDSPPFMEKEYYKVVEDTPSKGFTVEEYYKVIGDTPIKGFTAEEYYKITEGPEKADSLDILDKPPEVEQTQDHEKIKEEVKKYFSESFSNFGFEPKDEAPIDIGGKNGKADLELYVPEKGKCVAIAEAKKGKKDANYGRRQLFAYLSATNTRFGIFANSLNPDNWIFYENLRHFRFCRIERSQFEEKVAAGNYDMPDKLLKPKDCTVDINSVIETMGSARRCQENKIEDIVKSYFSPLLQQSYGSCRELKSQQRNVWINTDIKFEEADFILQGQDGSYIAIVEFRNNKSPKKSILDPMLCATDTRFGIRATSKKWYFYERQGSHRPGEIEADEFAAKVIAQAKEAACPVFKGDRISKEDWDEYSKTWKTLKSEKVWRVAKIYHPKCSLKIDKYISDDEYNRAKDSYPGCSVKKGDTLTKAELDEQRKTWPKLTTEKGWRVTEVFHPRCSFRVGQYISHTEYEQARVDYPGYSVKNGDILTKAEFTERRKTWKNLKAKKVWCVTETDYQQLQKRIQDDRNESQSIIKLWQSIWGVTADEYDRAQSKIKLWQFITAGVGIFLVCFAGLFLMQRNATEDAVHQNAVFINQLTQKESEIGQKDRKIQSLTTSVQTLNSENETLNQKVSELENSERNRTFSTETTSVDVVSLKRQLSERTNENQKLQNQLVKRDAEIRQLQNDKATTLNENSKLQSQLVENRQRGVNQSATVRQLQSENQKLQNRNQDLTRQNQELREKNKVLQNQFDNAKQSDSDQVNKSSNSRNDDRQLTTPPQTKNIVAEPPEKIQDYSDVITRAGSHNNQGYLDFEHNDYEEAIKQFEQAIKADSKFAVAHYNLGCAYLEIKEYQSAVDAFDGAIAVDPKFKEAYYNRSIAYFRMDRFQEAKQDAAKALDIDSNYQLARELLTAVETSNNN